MTASVIIPAHNEEAVIERCLSSLLTGADKDELRIWVVANGCTDKTAERARQFHCAVQVIETDVPSKTHALNLGDNTASEFPRFYVDADIILTITALRTLRAALSEPGIMAVSPLLEIDDTQCSWAVRAFYDVWRRLPYCQTGISGAGVYGLTEEGRSRFGEFPCITGDDAFVRMHFAPHERKTVSSCRSIVTPPTTLRKVIDIKTRSHFGNAELRRRFPHLWSNEHINHKSALIRLMAHPRLWPAICVYMYVKAKTRARVRTRLQQGDACTWERDDTSRSIRHATMRAQSRDAPWIDRVDPSP